MTCGKEAVRKPDYEKEGEKELFKFLLLYALHSIGTAGRIC